MAIQPTMQHLMCISVMRYALLVNAGGCRGFAELVIDATVHSSGTCKAISVGSRSCSICRVAGREVCLCLIGGMFPLLIVADRHACDETCGCCLLPLVPKVFFGRAVCVYTTQSSFAGGGCAVCLGPVADGCCQSRPVFASRQHWDSILTCSAFTSS